ncbi:MAG: hypothetical protein JXA73_01130 [Acidobacteria bacterium]|nr:hypothetical protein [Acidobacteriota bacterium]
MNEGWFKNDYLILFSETEIAEASKNYCIAQLLPSYAIIGLLGWDDFLLRDQSGTTYSIPAVPIDKEYLKEYELPNSNSLKQDDRFRGKIKWHVKPLIFGGNPNDEQNLTWVTHEQHTQLVMWWNNQYRALGQ